MKGVVEMATDKYIPVFNRQERPVEFCESEGYFTLYEFASGVGILQTADADERFVKNQAAFLFGKSPDELYFRFSFEWLMHISNDDPGDDALRKKLYNTSTGVYGPQEGEPVLGIPVYHDALDCIDKLKQPHDEGDCKMEPRQLSENMSDAYFLNPFATPESAARMEKEVEAFFKKTHGLDVELEEAINAELEMHPDAKVLSAVHYFGNNRLYPYSIATIGRRMLIFVLAHLSGNWLADEESFNGERPLWFTETEHEASPAHQGLRIREYLQGKLSPDTDIDVIVVCPRQFVVVNAEDLKATWDSMGVHVCWANPPHEECTSLKDALAAIDFGSGAPIDADYDRIQKFVSSFNIDPSNENQEPKKEGKL